MKHIKLFENFAQMAGMRENPALIVAKGDWTGITKDGAVPPYTSPLKYMVTYYANPTQDQIDQALNYDPAYGEEIWNPSYAVAEIMGGDQEGNNLAKDDQEGLAILVDKSKGPEMIERELRDILDVFNEGGDTGADQFMSVLEDPGAKDNYTPAYLNHCRACAGNDMGPWKKRLMKRELIFKVV